MIEFINEKDLSLKIDKDAILTLIKFEKEDLKIVLSEDSLSSVEHENMPKS